MNKARISYRATIIPISKPLVCWLVADNDATPWGPHEVHAMAVITYVASSEAHEVVSGGLKHYDIPQSLYRESEMIFDVGVDPECHYFVPTAQLTGDGTCWWPAKYISFTPEGCFYAHKRIQESRETNK